MAHGMRQGTSFLPPKMKGKLEEKLGTAWMAGNMIFPMLEDSSKPKIPFTWLNVTCFCTLSTFLVKEKNTITFSIKAIHSNLLCNDV